VRREQEIGRIRKTQKDKRKETTQKKNKGKKRRARGKDRS
jgi:hypothetical protein